MAKRVRELDTPFRKGERVLTTRNVGDVKEGTTGTVQLTNGLGNWRRYWVKFEGNLMRGQVSHSDLVRPDQLGDWLAREDARVEAALRSEQTGGEEEESAAAAVGAGDGDGGVASQIPAHLLERSKAAKARLLG